MKRNFRLLLLTPVAFLSVGCGKNKEDSNKVDVIVISGQSNAVGCTFSSCLKANQSDEKYREYKEGYSGVRIAYQSMTKDFDPIRFYSQNRSYKDEFEYVQLGQGNSTRTFGPEIGIAEKMHKKHANKLFIIKYACGSSNLQDDWTEKDSPMYGNFINFVKESMQNLKNQGYDPTIKAFCWMQGEGDSYDGYYQNYYENLKFFVTNVRHDLMELTGNKEVPFIDAGISDAEPWVYYKEVNDAKKQFASESDNNYYIDTIAAGLHTNQEPFDIVDPCHYDSESQLKLGYLFSEAFEKFLI